MLPPTPSACKSALSAEEDPVRQRVRGGRMGIGTCHPPLSLAVFPIVGIKTPAGDCRHHEIPCTPGQPQPFVPQLPFVQGFMQPHHAVPGDWAHQSLSTVHGWCCFMDGCRCNAVDIGLVEKPFQHTCLYHLQDCVVNGDYLAI